METETLSVAKILVDSILGFAVTGGMIIFVFYMKKMLTGMENLKASFGKMVTNLALIQKDVETVMRESTLSKKFITDIRDRLTKTEIHIEDMQKDLEKCEQLRRRDT